MDNNSPNPQPDLSSNPNNRIIIGISVALGVLLIVGVIIFFVNRQNNNTRVTINITPAPASSPTPSASPTASATPSTASTAPNYTGFDSLTDDGLSSDQENDAQFAFVKFAKVTGLKLTEVDLDTGSLVVTPHSPTSTTDISNATFNVVLNNKVAYKANLAYSGLTAADLVLTNPTTGAQVYDSGQIDVYNGIGD